MTYYERKDQLLLFVRLFLVLFFILFVLPQIVDAILSMFNVFQMPKGNSILVLKNFCSSMNFGQKYLIILKNLIINM